MNPPEQNKRTLTVKTPEDLLALVPQVLGFHPEDSVVLLTVGSDRPVHMRVDLPRDPADRDLVRGEVRDALRRNRAHRVVVVVYSTEAAVAAETAGMLVRGLTEDGFEVLDALRADGRCWRRLRVAGPGRRGGEDGEEGAGTAYDVGAHPLTVQSVFEGRVTLGSRRELADSLVGTDPEAFDAVEEAAEEAAAGVPKAAEETGPAGRPGTPAAWARWVESVVHGFVGEGRPLTHRDAGRLLVALREVELRDVAWAQMTREDARVHVDLWRDLLRRCPHALEAAPAALLAFAAWLAGDGALAWCAVDRCVAADPDYRLGQLVGQALEGAVPPHAWSGLDREDLSVHRAAG